MQNKELNKYLILPNIKLLELIPIAMVSKLSENILINFLLKEMDSEMI